MPMACMRSKYSNDSNDDLYSVIRPSDQHRNIIQVVHKMRTPLVFLNDSIPKVYKCT